MERLSNSRTRIRMIRLLLTLLLFCSLQARVDANHSFSQGLGAMDLLPGKWSQDLQTMAIKSLSPTVVEYGLGKHQSFGRLLSQNSVAAVGAYGAGHFSRQIGIDYKHGTLNYAQRMAGHMVVSTASQALQDGVLGKGLQAQRLLGASIGALSAELTGDIYTRLCPQDDNQGLSQSQRNLGLYLSQLSSVLTASALNQDMQAALASGTIAAQENAFFVPLILVGLSAYEAYDLYQTYQRDGAEAALTQAGISIGLAASGGVVVKYGGKLGGKVITKVYPNLHQAWLGLVESNPILGKVIAVADGGINAIKQLDSQASQAVAKLWRGAGGKGVGKSVGPINTKPLEAIRADAIPTGSQIEYLSPGRVRFDGVEFRAVRDLSHISEEGLRKMVKAGNNPRDLNLIRLDGHHHLQRYHREPGSFIAEIPESAHCISKPNQHPLGNKGGLTKAERGDWNKTRKAFNKERARTELLRRGLHE